MSAPGGLAALAGRRVAIWGSGLEGRGVAALLLHRGGSVVFVADAPGGTVDVAGGAVEVAPVAALAAMDVDALVRSPGVSRYRPEVTAAVERGLLVTTASALWFTDFADAPVIGVTGSKGKTTTATLASLLLQAAGRTVGLGGNMGEPVTAFYDESRRDAYVVEVSSYQAADVTASPPVGVLTLLAPDHLDWHGGYERYVADKLNLFAHRAGAALAVNAASPAARAATDRCGGRVLYGEAGPVALDAAGDVTVDGSRLDVVLPPSLRGRHNAVNLCGAVSAVRLLTGEPVDRDTVALALERMPALPSRLRTVAVRGGVEWVDDALASNPAGAAAGLRAFAGRPVCLIAGGHDRGADLGELVVAVVEARPAPTVVVLGDAGERLAAELARAGAAARCERAASVEDAVALAAALLADASGGGGDPVALLSPGAPTPPADGSYAERAGAFRRAVDALAP